MTSDTISVYLFREGDTPLRFPVNPSSLHVFVGKVISASPLTVMIDNRIAISENNLLLTSRVCHGTITLSHSHTDTNEDEISQEITITKSLCLDDLVVLLRCHGGGSYIILDKLNRKD